MATATYAALVSLLHVRNHVRVYDSTHDILYTDQLTQLETLNKKVSFLLDFIEEYSTRRIRSHEIEILESRITEAAYVAEDIIETYIVDDIPGVFWHIGILSSYRLVGLARRSLVHDIVGSSRFSHDLQGVIECFGSIEREVEEIKAKGSTFKDPRSKEPDCVVGLHTTGETTIVGFERDFKTVREMLTVHNTNIQIVTITGMGGIGKSTLAKKVFDHYSNKNWFDICAWVTVSQEFDLKEMFLELLCQTGAMKDKSEGTELDVHKLGEKVHKQLFGRRYFIIIDDIWSVEAWDRAQSYLPDCNKSSRVMITTRLLNLAKDIGSSSIHKMNLLDENESWSMLQQKVFAQQSCPPELEEIGKEIATKCEGLPLSISVIAGPLAKSKNQESWECIGDNISSVVNAEGNDCCLKILHLSYCELPIHLKACFLYFATYPEDHEIQVFHLVNLWVAEGLIKPNGEKILEDVANEYLQDLIGRNLIMVTKFGYMGKVELIKIHDLIRDFCVRESYKERMLYVFNAHTSQVSHGLYSTRRLVISSKDPWQKLPPPQLYPSHSSLVLRSLTCNSRLSSEPSFDAKLLRVLRTPRSCLSRKIYELLNSRYLEFDPRWIFFSSLSHSVHLLWNLQTIYLPRHMFNAPPEIWEMPQLRQIITRAIFLPDPDIEDNIVLEHLQTLGMAHEFRCTKAILKKIPKIRELVLGFSDTEHLWPSYCLDNLASLEEIVSLDCRSMDVLMDFKLLGFSTSLKVVTISGYKFEWEDIGTKIGSLPQLEVLRLSSCSTDKEWISVEGQFPCLTVLRMVNLDVVSWIAESCVFERLERLELEGIDDLKEIPSEIGEIPTLQCIEVRNCEGPVCESAQRIQEEQENLGNNISVVLSRNSVEDRLLASIRNLIG